MPGNECFSLLLMSMACSVGRTTWNIRVFSYLGSPAVLQSKHHWAAFNRNEQGFASNAVSRFTLNCFPSNPSRKLMNKIDIPSSIPGSSRSWSSRLAQSLTLHMHTWPIYIHFCCHVLTFFPHICWSPHNVHCSIVRALGVNSFRSVFPVWRPCVIHQYLWGPVDQISLEQPSLISNLALRITGLSFTLFIYVLCSYHNDKSHIDNSRIPLWKVVLAIILWPYVELSMIWWINSPLHA